MDDYYKQLTCKLMNTWTGDSFGIVLAGNYPADSRALASKVFIELQIPIMNSQITNYK